MFLLPIYVISIVLQSPKYFVKIRQLENAVDGGILDVDDYVYDVAEDRDQVTTIVIFFYSHYISAV